MCDCFLLVDTAIRNPQSAIRVFRCMCEYGLLPSATLDYTSITTLDYTSIITLDYTSITTLDYTSITTLDCTSIFYARLCHHLPLSFLTISSNPTANDLLAMRLSPSHLHYRPTLQQTMHISPYILSNNVLCPPKMAHT